MAYAVAFANRVFEKMDFSGVEQKRIKANTTLRNAAACYYVSFGLYLVFKSKNG